MSDGILTDKERSMLDIQADSYGLSVTRRKFLEESTMDVNVFQHDV